MEYSINIKKKKSYRIPDWCFGEILYPRIYVNFNSNNWKMMWKEIDTYI